MSYFKKIFDLDPKEVEAFIENHVKEYTKKYCDSEEDYNEWLNDHDIEIRWHPTVSEFYVGIEPKLETKDYEHFYFKSDKELTAGEYFRLAFDHYHYYFGEIYGLITGEAVCYSTLGTGIPNQNGYLFIINKEYKTVIHDLPTNKFYLQDWDDEKDEPILTPIADDFVKEIEDCIKECIE